MTEACIAAVDQAVPDKLIGIFKVCPNGRYSRGVRCPTCFLMLMAMLGSLSFCRSSSDLETFARRHRAALNQKLNLDFMLSTSDATFLYLYRFAEAGGYGQVQKA